MTAIQCVPESSILRKIPHHIEATDKTIMQLTIRFKCYFI